MKQVFVVINIIEIKFPKKIKDNITTDFWVHILVPLI